MDKIIAQAQGAFTKKKFCKTLSTKTPDEICVLNVIVSNSCKKGGCSARPNKGLYPSRNRPCRV